MTPYWQNKHLNLVNDKSTVLSFVLKSVQLNVRVQGSSVPITKWHLFICCFKLYALCLHVFANPIAVDWNVWSCLCFLIWKACRDDMPKTEHMSRFAWWYWFHFGFSCFILLCLALHFYILSCLALPTLSCFYFTLLCLTFITFFFIIPCDAVTPFALRAYFERT